MSNRDHTPTTNQRLDGRSRLAECKLVKAVAASMVEADLGHGARLVVGCSGGPDSTALMVALWLLRERLQLVVQVVCVDHGLRKAAAEEALLVEEVALRLGLSARRMTVRVAKQSSVQAAARSARYHALLEAARDFGSQSVLVAHTLNDQAETVLQRVLGGAGPRGLSGMPAQRVLGNPSVPQSLKLVRPLLTIERSQVEAFLTEAQHLISPLPLTDPSNFDLRFTRSVIRHNLLPQIQAMQPAVLPHLGRLAAQLREDADYLDALARQKLPEVVDWHAEALPDQLAALSVTRLQALPKPLSSRLLSHLAQTSLGSVHLTALHRLYAHSRGTQSLDLPDGLVAERRYDTLYLRRRAIQSVPSAAEPTILPGCGSYQRGPYHIRLRYIHDDDAPIGDSPKSLVLTLPAPGFPLWLRQPRAGDRLRLPGGHRKISDILIDAKLPRAQRSMLLVLGHQEEPLWLLGLRVAVPSPPRELCYVKIVVELRDVRTDDPSRTATT